MPEIVDIEIFYECLKKLCIKWAAKRLLSPVVPPPAGGRWCRRHQRGTGPQGPWIVKKEFSGW